MNKRDQIIKQHFYNLGKASAEARKKKLGTEGLREQMANLSQKGVEARKRNQRKRALVVNLDNPERNCKVCKADHQFITDDNRATYRKAHEEHLAI